jgi:ATP adenylyltransferase
MGRPVREGVMARKTAAKAGPATSKTRNSKTKSKSPKKSKSTNGKGKWPQKRDILWRPGRFTYLANQHKIVECVFCDAKAQGLKPETLLVFENGTSMVMLNKYPYNNGHLLVLPVRHVADIESLSEEEFSDINRIVRTAVSALRKSYEKAPQGINIGVNLGVAAGAGIPQHLHYHVIPRWVGDSNFFPLVGQTKVISETLEQTYLRLVPYFK